MLTLPTLLDFNWDPKPEGMIRKTNRTRLENRMLLAFILSFIHSYTHSHIHIYIQAFDSNHATILSLLVFTTPVVSCPVLLYSTLLYSVLIH